jgi:hypothetical protein
VIGRAAAALALALALGCGYATGRIVPAKAQSVGVEVFENDSPLRDLEVRLHDEITRSVRDLVEVPIVDPGSADLIVRGRIVDYRRRDGVRNGENQLLETSVMILANAELVDRHTGATLARSAPPYVDIGFVLNSPDIGNSPNEAPARERAITNLAEQMVLDLFAPAD